MPEITMIGSDPSGVPAKAQIDGSGNLKVAVTGAGSGGTSSVDEAGFTASASAGTPLMGAVTPGDTVASGKLAVAAMQVDRSLNVYVTGQAGGGSAVSVADGADVTQGAIADAAVSTDAVGTVNAHVRGFVKLLASVISVGRLVVDPSGVTSPVSAASLPLPTGAAAEAGNLATIVTNIGAVTASPTANTLMDRVKQLLTGIVLSAGTALIGKVGLDQTTPGTTNAIADIPVTAGGLSIYAFLSTAAVQAAQIKGSAGQVYALHFFNLSATIAYVRLYNMTGAPGTGDTVVYRALIPGNTSGAGFVVPIPPGVAFGTGIGIRVTAAVADNDNTALAANVVLGNVFYK